MKHRKLIVAGAAVNAVVLATGTAFAVWTTTATTGTQSVPTSTVLKPAAATAVAAGQTSMTISVTQAPASGPTPTAYQVDRTAPTTKTNACTISTVTNGLGSCTDSGLVAGTQYTYTITSKLGTNWVSATQLTGVQGTTSSAGDTTAPTKTALSILDANGNGKIDAVTITFDEAMSSSSTGTGVSITGLPSGGTVSSTPTVSGSTVTFAVNETAEAVDTSVGSIKVALAANSGLKDVAGNSANSFTATAPADAAAPVLSSLQMLDANTNGKVDQVKATFSESLATYTAGSTPWTLANVPSAGSLNNVTIGTGGNDNTATLALTEGSGAANTAVGSFTVALATNSAGIRDAAGNQSSFTATAPADKAGPVAIALASANCTPAGASCTSGKADPNDTLSVTFSEPILGSSVTSSSTVTLASSNGANPTTTITITGLIAPGFDSNALYEQQNKTAVFAGTLSQPTSSVVQLRLNSVTSNNGSLNTVTSTAGFTLTPASSLTDAAGNAAGGTLSASNPLF